MTVEELMEILSDMPEDAEVRLAQQPHWPFEYGIANGTFGEAVILVGGERPDCPQPKQFQDREEYEEAYCEWEELCQRTPLNPVVYIAEGKQIGYLPGVASRALGWRE